MSLPIPVFLNEPDKVVFWTWNELTWFLGILMFMWLMASFLLGLVLSITVVKVLRMLQKSALGDLTRIGPYWFLPSAKSFKTLPPSDIREFLG